MLGRLKWGLAVVTIIVPSLSFFTQFVHADITSCFASVSPNQVDPNTSLTFQMVVKNTDATNSISWIKVTRPSANFVISTSSTYGWASSNTDNDLTLGGSTLTPDNLLTIYADTTVANTGSTVPAANWRIQASDDPNGANPFDCSGGDLSTAIVVVDVTPPVISNVVISNLLTTSATIHWDTDEPSSSQVNFGKTDAYGISLSDTSLTTSHTVTLSNLLANTGYHFQAVSADGSNNYAYSSDSTFLTPSTPPPAPASTPPPSSSQTKPSVETSINTSGPLNTVVPIKKVPTEKTPPVVNLTTPIANPYKTIPEISGTASDNEALAALEYSTDNGKNWLPVDHATGLGSSKAKFSFIIKNLNDGNYQVSARAVDTSGNITSTTPFTLVIDKLPPLVGGNILSVGPQNIQPNTNGIITAVSGVDQKITISCIGGPINITIEALLVGSSKISQKFTLTNSVGTDLWTGILSFGKPGNYQIVARALDGAGNETTRELNTVTVKESGFITDNKAVRLDGVKVEVFFRDPETNNWTLWDGSSYSQTNPARTNTKGLYGFYLPAGTYYLKVSKAGYQTVTTRSFTLDNPSIVSKNIQLPPKPSLQLGPLRLSLPWPSLAQAPIDISGTNAKNTADTKPKPLPAMPDFSLAQTDGKNITTEDLYGKPSIVSFVSTWAPTSRDQLAVLNELKSPEINLIAVGSGEDLLKLSVYMNNAGYNLPVLADPANQLTQAFGATTLPAHYFIDRHGVVKKLMVGLLSKEELLNNVEY